MLLVFVLKPATHPYLVCSSSSPSILLVAQGAAAPGGQPPLQYSSRQELFASFQEDDEGDELNSAGWNGKGTDN